MSRSSSCKGLNVHHCEPYCQRHSRKRRSKKNWPLRLEDDKVPPMLDAKYGAEKGILEIKGLLATTVDTSKIYIMTDVCQGTTT